MGNSRFIDEIFDTNNCLNYILSIQCSLNGFSFLIYDPLPGKVISLIEHESSMATPFELMNELISFFNTEPALKHQFKKVNASFLSQRSVLIPQFIENKDEWPDLFNLTFGQIRDEQILGNEIAPQSTILLFAVPSSISRCLKNQYSNCEFYAPAFPIINHSFKVKINQPQLLVSRFRDLLIICLVHDNKIHFLNHFYVKNDIDCLYYILSTAQHLNLDNKTELKIFGKIDPQSELIGSVRNYFSKIIFAFTSKDYNMNNITGNIFEHYHLPLLELALCE